MIQRKQTLFLLIAVILGIVALSMPIASVTAEGLRTAEVYNLFWRDQVGNAHYSVWPLFVILLIASAFALYTIFIYKRRMVQAAYCLVSILLYVAWYIVLIVYSKSLAPDALNFHLSLASALPAVSAIFCLMARKGIIADERLVKAADRIR